MGGISVAGLLVRLGLALTLVLATFNPSGYSILHWLASPPVSFAPGKVLAALILLSAWFMCLRTTFVSLGKGGLLLGMALFGVLVWFLVDQNILSLTGSMFVWVVLVVVGVLLGIGLSWSLIRAKVTGQLEVQ